MVDLYSALLLSKAMFWISHSYPLRLSPVSSLASSSYLADVVCHVGWKDSASASYFLRLAHVLRAEAPADALIHASLSAADSTRV